MWRLVFLDSETWAGSVAHWRLFYHLVRATRDRQPWLASTESVRLLEHALVATGEEFQIKFHALGTMPDHVHPDHVHLACSIPPRLAIAEIVRRLKGASSHRLNQTVFADGKTLFAWQAEYGVYSFAERSLTKVVDSVRNQRTRHATGDLWLPYERTESEQPALRAANPRTGVDITP